MNPPNKHNNINSVWEQIEQKKYGNSAEMSTVGHSVLIVTPRARKEYPWKTRMNFWTILMYNNGIVVSLHNHIVRIILIMLCTYLQNHNVKSLKILCTFLYIIIILKMRCSFFDIIIKSEFSKCFVLLYIIIKSEFSKRLYIVFLRLLTWWLCKVPTIMLIILYNFSFNLYKQNYSWSVEHLHPVVTTHIHNHKFVPLKKGFASQHKKNFK